MATKTLNSKKSAPDAVENLINTALKKIDITIAEMDKIRTRLQTVRTPADGTPAVIVKP